MVGYKAVVGKYEGLGGWVSQVLDDGPSRIEKLAQCLVSRVGSGFPTLLVRLVQHSYLKMPRTFQKKWPKAAGPGVVVQGVRARRDGGLGPAVTNHQGF